MTKTRRKRAIHRGLVRGQKRLAFFRLPTEEMLGVLVRMTEGMAALWEHDAKVQKLMAELQEKSAGIIKPRKLETLYAEIR